MYGQKLSKNCYEEERKRKKSLKWHHHFLIIYSAIDDRLVVFLTRERGLLLSKSRQGGLWRVFSAQNVFSRTIGGEFSRASLDFIHKIHVCDGGDGRESGPKQRAIVAQRHTDETYANQPFDHLSIYSSFMFSFRMNFSFSRKRCVVVVVLPDFWSIHFCPLRTTLTWINFMIYTRKRKTKREPGH